MSEKNCRTRSLERGLLALCWSSIVAAGIANAAIDGTGANAIDGTGLRVIDGTGANVIDGTGLRVIDGTGALVIDGTGARVIDGTGANVIDGTGLRVIDGTGALVIDGTGANVIDGTGHRAIDGTGAQAIDGTGLLVLGQVEAIGNDFISVLGQTVFGSESDFAGISAGATIAVYGSIDTATGGFVDTRIVPVSPTGIDSGVPSFLRGTVDEVDASLGRAVVSGVLVDYNALLSRGGAPRVGEQVAVSGRSYRGMGLLVAEPGLDLSLR